MTCHSHIRRLITLEGAKPFHISTYFHVGEKVKQYIEALWGTSKGTQVLTAGLQQGIVTELLRASRAHCQLTLHYKRKFRNPTPSKPLEIMARNLREGVGLSPT